METITQPAREVPVLAEADICVVGGGCTGAFAAVRAARLGARIVILEKQNCLGGVVGSGLLTVWHTLLDADYREQVIAGLTEELLARIEAAGALSKVDRNPSVGYRFDPNVFKVELERLVAGHKIELYYHAGYASAAAEGQAVQAVLVSTKEGLRAVKAKFFIDATGDGDLMRDLKIEAYQYPKMQPPSACFFMQGNARGDLAELIAAHGAEFGLEDDWGWKGEIPGLRDIVFRCDNHVFGVDCSKAGDLTRAEIEGRRRAYALVNLLKKYDSADCAIVSLCSYIGVRDTNHYRTRFMATERALLAGARYDTAVMNGTYRVDIHHSDDNGISFKYLDGKIETFYGKSAKCVSGNWRKELNLTGESAKYYQVPFEILVQEQYRNVIAAGRMLHADEGAFGALRVMVNLNQLGEAAGVAAYLAVDAGVPVQEVDGIAVRAKLRQGGSAL